MNNGNIIKNIPTIIFYSFISVWKGGYLFNKSELQNNGNKSKELYYMYWFFLPLLLLRSQF